MVSNSKIKKLSEVNETMVEVHMPSCIEIELVQGNELRHYEMFQWLVALLAPLAVGFWTAYFTTLSKPPELWWSALVFSLLSALFIGLAWNYRRKVFHGSTIKKMALKEFEIQ